MIKNIEFSDTFYFLLEIYKLIIDGRSIPIRELKMVSSRFSGKTHAVEQLITLLMLQPYKRIVCNYVRARGEDAFKAMDTIEERILEFSGGEAKVKPNVQKKHIKWKNNKVNFTILNEIKEKVAKTGGKIGVPIEYNADYIITFYEEASQLEKELVENHRQSVRGHKNTKMLFIYASNPWMKTHWLIEEMARKLPEKEQNEAELEDKGYNHYFDKYTKTLYFRPRWTRNTFLNPDQVKEIDLLKDVNYAKWRIVSLGFSGLLSGSLYGAALKKLNENVEYRDDVELYAGIDWGDGKSAKASPSTAYLVGISQDGGIDVYGEYEWYNNKGEEIDTIEQFKRFVTFIADHPQRKGRKVTAYIDNAAMGDFFQMGNNVAAEMGYENEIEFWPAWKLMNTWERVEVLNILIGLGIFRFKREDCPSLYDALENCYEVVKTNPTEEMKRQRSHEWTHWIHAIEYAIGTWFLFFKERFPVMTSIKEYFK